MNAPEKCPKCGASFVQVETDDWGDRVLNYARFKCETTVYEDRQLRLQGHFCIIKERDQLAERVRELEVWKESAMAVEREWDPNQLAAMLGGQLGEPQRAVIQREVPVLVERVKQLEAVVTDPHALWSNWLRGDIQLPAGIGDIRECSEKMKRFRSRWLATHQELRKAEDYIELLESEKSC